MVEATRLTFELIWASRKDRTPEGVVTITEDVLKRVGMEAGLDEPTAQVCVCAFCV
jgi:hypothetical protein